NQAGNTLESLKLSPGSSVQLSATAADKHLKLYTEGGVFQWSNASTKFGRISESGLYTALTPGDDRITVTCGGRSQSIPVEVSKVPLKELEDFEQTPSGTGDGAALVNVVGGEYARYGRGAGEFHYDLSGQSPVVTQDNSTRMTPEQVAELFGDDTIPEEGIPVSWEAASDIYGEETSILPADEAEEGLPDESGPVADALDAGTQTESLEIPNPASNGAYEPEETAYQYEPEEVSFAYSAPEWEDDFAPTVHVDESLYFNSAAYADDGETTAPASGNTTPTRVPANTDSGETTAPVSGNTTPTPVPANTDSGETTAPISGNTTPTPVPANTDSGETTVPASGNTTPTPVPANTDDGNTTPPPDSAALLSGDDGAQWHYTRPIPAPGIPYESVSIWVKGDGSGNRFSLLCRNADGQELRVPVTALDFTEWRRLFVPLGTTTYSIAGYAVHAPSGTADDTVFAETPRTGVIYLDQMVATYNGIVDTVTPTVTMSRNSNVITATVRDSMDGVLPRASIRAAVNGVAASAAYN
ncbi:MAG: hypothetical protein IJT31_06645, partial [Oscillibacter sp.]|nr:hypothetical protein [Oscillibacter sp.]